MSVNVRFLACAVVPLACIALSERRASAAFLLGDWESSSSDQWIDWGTQASYAGGATSLPTPKYQFSSTGATAGTSALQITQNGYNQDLAIKLEWITGAMAAFQANNALAIDVTLPATASTGYSQIYDLAVNAPTWGFKSLTTNPVPGAQWGWGATGGPQQTYHLVFDYSAAKAAAGPTPGYVEFIFATNNDSVHNQFFFDNAQLVTTPEPVAGSMTIAALGLLARRKR